MLNNTAFFLRLIQQFLFTAIFFGFLIQMAPAQTDGEPERVRVFKEFISAPKEIEEIVVQHQLLIVPTAPVPGVKISADITNTIKYSKGAWKTNGFYFREARRVNDADKLLGGTNVNQGLLLAGRLGQRSWSIVNTNINSSYGTDNFASKDPLQTSAMSAERNLLLFLTFGIARARSIDFTSTQDGFVTQIEGEKSPIQGLLTVSNGYVTGVKLKGADGVIFRECEYGYASPGSTLPDRAVIYGIRNGVRQPQLKIEYLSLRVATNGLADDRLRPEQFVNTDWVSHSVFTNGIFYDLINGMLVKRYDFTEKNGDRASKSIFATFFLLTLIIPLVYLVFVARKKERKKQL